MKVGCCFSAFLPILASHVNWHRLLNGIAGVCKLLLQLSLIIDLDEWNWHDWPPTGAETQQAVEGLRLWGQQEELAS